MSLVDVSAVSMSFIEFCVMLTFTAVYSFGFVYVFFSPGSVVPNLTIMSLHNYTTLFEAYTNEYNRLTAEAMLCRQAGRHGNFIVVYFWCFYWLC
jgi:hypothetical protein